MTNPEIYYWHKDLLDILKGIQRAFSRVLKLVVQFEKLNAHKLKAIHFPKC
jgi:hypothetical protein